MAGAEAERLAEDARRARNWKRWGPYLAERQWGTVREDYSADGNVWDYFSHDQARSRAYRWGEDGLLGITDRQGRLCFALALWNGRDPILKERLFGLTGPEGNHGEDVKEAYFYLDSTPTHSYLKALYKYPQAEFPYERLVRENRERGKSDPEFELADTGVFDDQRYFDVFAEYAKADPDDILIRITVANRGPEAATVHLLPTLWFRNTWSWGREGEGYWPKPGIRPSGSAGMVAEHAVAGRATRSRPRLAGRRPGARRSSSPRTRPTSSRLFGSPNAQPYVKDAFHRAIDRGRRVGGESAGDGHQGRGPLRPHRPGRRRAGRAAPAPPGGRRRRAPRSGRGSTGCSREPDRARRTSSTRERVPRGRDRRRAAGRCGRGTPGCSGASSSTTTSSPHWLEGDPSQPAPPAERGGRAATPSGRTSTTATSSRCRTSGSTPGTPPGTSPST